MQLDADTTLQDLAQEAFLKPLLRTGDTAGDLMLAFGMSAGA